MSAFGRAGAWLYGLVNRHRESNNVVVDLAELGPDDRALEVGCGPGASVELAARRIGADRVAAVDPTPTFVTMVRKRVPGADVRLAGAEDIPFPDRSFTVAWSLASMHHWDDRDAGLATITAKLTASGRLLLAERLLDKDGHGITAEQLDEVTAHLRTLGYDTVDTVERRVGRKTIVVIRARL